MSVVVEVGNGGGDGRGERERDAARPEEGARLVAAVVETEGSSLYGGKGVDVRELTPVEQAEDSDGGTAAERVDARRENEYENSFLTSGTLR